MSQSGSPVTWTRAGDALRLEVRRERARGGREQHVRERVGLDAVALLGHVVAVGPQAGLDVDQRDAGGRRGPRAGERRVRVAAHEHGVGRSRAMTSSDPLGPDLKLVLASSANPRRGCSAASAAASRGSVHRTWPRRAITRGSDGALWFTLYGDSDGPGAIGRLTTAGAFTEYPTPFAPSFAGLAAGPDGALWFSAFAPDQFGNYYIGRMTTAGVVTQYLLPNHGPAGAKGRAYPTYVWDIVAGPDHAMWFPEFNSDQNGNSYIGRITTTGVITEYLLPTQYAAPTYITLGPDGALWFTGFFPSGRGIGRITTRGAVTWFSDPVNPSISYNDIATGPDGNLWLTDSAGGSFIWRVTTAGTFTKYTIPSGGWPWRITRGPGQDLLFTQQSPNIGRITTAGVITEYPIPSGFTMGITMGPDRAVWFVNRITGADQIGRLGQ